jgi:hypothetical protein
MVRVKVGNNYPAQSFHHDFLSHHFMGLSLLDHSKMPQCNSDSFRLFWRTKLDALNSLSAGGFDMGCPEKIFDMRYPTGSRFKTPLLLDPCLDLFVGCHNPSIKTRVTPQYNYQRAQITAIHIEKIEHL